MVGKSIKGSNACYVCGYELNWEKIADAGIGQMVLFEKPEVSADAVAVGKNEDGTIQFEIICTCSRCRSRNKFIKNVQV